MVLVVGMMAGLCCLFNEVKEIIHIVAVGRDRRENRSRFCDYHELIQKLSLVEVNRKCLLTASPSQIPLWKHHFLRILLRG